MECYPKTLIEFEDWFSTEESCHDYLVKLRWPDGFKYPRCSKSNAWFTSRGLYKCISCKTQTSVTAGTIFQDTKKPLRIWFHAIWHLTNQKFGANALGLKNIMGFGSYRTAWTLLHKLRLAMVRPGRDCLSGIVEVDETYIGGRKAGKRGRGSAGKALVVVAAQDIDNKIGRIRMTRVADASSESLQKAVQKMIEPNSTIRTDGWKGYMQLSNMGYKHIISRNGADIGKNLLPLAHRIDALVKRWLVGTYQGAVRISHLDYYLDEYTFRFNRRTSRSRGKLFYRLVQQAVQVAPVLGNDIKGGAA